MFVGRISVSIIVIKESVGGSGESEANTEKIIR